jgi:hypothetical protein
MVVVCLGRDTALWIEGHIEHHLELGARHVFYLDNASRDDAVEAASRYDRVSVFTTDISFNRYEVGLRRWLTKRFGRNRWCLATDADELWDYPMSDRLRLPGFLRYLRHYGYKAVTGHMLDLFSDRPFSQLDSRPGDPLRENYRFYDLSDLAETRDVYWIRDGLLATDAFGCIFGGVRKRFFGDADLCLTKHPLVFADDTVGVYTYDVHFMTGAPVADVSTVLLHYKYVSSLPDRSRAAMVDNWFKESASLYAGLNRVLTDQPDLCLRLSSSRELDDVQELVDCGFLNVSPEYRDWIERYGDG